MMKLHDFISTQPVFPEDICEDLITLFENNPDCHDVRKNKIQDFTELNVVNYFPELGALLGRKMRNIVEDYTDVYCPFTPMFPERWGIEQFRIKRYNEGQSFGPHVDVGSATSCMRFLAFLFYLNDDFEGGGTMFRTPEVKYIKPKRGQVLVFPPTWQYPHEGMPVTKGTKYIMSTYLHYQ